MHELFTKVLSNRDLSRAGELFSVSNADIVNDIRSVLSEIGPIISHPDYIKNNNDQSVVEICITRVLSCIRETKTTERYCASLIELLEICLLWNLQPTSNTKEDQPHAKIASDIISSIFLNYDNKELMKIALPIAVQFLPKGNRELCRNLASYLSLAAIDYAYLLHPHVSSIMESIMGGNYGLLKVLTQIYEVSPVVVTPFATQLITLLPQSESQEKLSVLQLCLLMARKTPMVLSPCVPQLCEILYDSETVQITMQILLHVTEQQPDRIVPYLERIKLITKANPNTIALSAQILSATGRISKEYAQSALEFILAHLPNVDRTSQAILLQEATKLCSLYPILFTDKVLACVRQKNENAPSQQSLQSVSETIETTGGVTIVNLNIQPMPTASPSSSSSAAAAATNKDAIATTTTAVVAPKSNPIAAAPAAAAMTQPGGTATTGRMHKSKKSRSSPSSPKLSEACRAFTVSNKNSKIPSNEGATSKAATTQQQTTAMTPQVSAAIVPSTPLHAGYTRRVKLGDSRSTGRLHPSGNNNRSITHLNIAAWSVGGLHKSMTRLSSSQQINQNAGGSAGGNGVGGAGAVVGASSSAAANAGATSICNNSNASSSFSGSGNVFSHTNSACRTNTLDASSASASASTTHTTNTNTMPKAATVTDFVTPVPPLSNNVIITGHNKWGIPSTQVTSGGVTVTTSPSKIRPVSQGPTTVLNSSNIILKYSTDALNQSMGSISIPQNVVSVHHASPATPQACSNTGCQKSVMKLPVNSSQEVFVSGPTTNITKRRNDNTSRTLLNANNNVLDQRMSVFEPYQIMRDPVQQFCEKHFTSIKTYMDEVSQFLPPPTRCSIEVSNEFAERRTKKVAKLYFACQIRGPHCLYAKTCFTMTTRNPRTWIHLMFLDFQVRHYVKEKCVLSTREPGISNLKNIWQILKCENRSFTELVTSQFPNSKDREILINELRHSGFLDVFEVSRTNATNQNCNELDYQWGCFLCNHPDKAVGFLNGSNQPMIEGQLKEKKGKWRLFRRWRTRYFTLSGAHLSCKGSSGGESIDINQIRSVKVSRGARNIPKAFEIFTADQTLILKPKGGKNAEEWVQCLSIVVAHSQARDNLSTKTSSLPARGAATASQRLSPIY